MQIKKVIRGVVMFLVFVSILILGNDQYRRFQQRQWQKFELSVAKIPNGTSLEDVKRLLGAPDHTSVIWGVFMNGGTPFLAASNPDAKKYGKPEQYEVFLWKSGGSTASLLMQNGQVSGRIFVRPQRPPNLLRRLRSALGL